MQSSEKSGQNLDPMFYWQFVKGYSDRLPCILIKGSPTPKILQIIINSPQVNFIIEDSEELVNFQNVVNRQRIRLTDKQFLKGLSTIDYLICDEKDTDYWLPVALCGVKVCFKEEIFNEQIHVLEYVERIDNWDSARNILT